MACVYSRDTIYKEINRLNRTYPNWADLSDEELFDLLDSEFPELNIDILSKSLSKNKTQKKRVKPKKLVKEFPYLIRFNINGKPRSFLSKVNSKDLTKPSSIQLYNGDGYEVEAHLPERYFVKLR